VIRSLPSRWRASVLVCARCEKKLGGGFGGDGRKPLSKLLRKLAGGKGRKADFGVIPVKCLKICPKRAVTVVTGANPRDWLIVPGGTPVDEVVVRLGLFAAERPGE
jgi:predicted metal-binding protein